MGRPKPLRQVIRDNPELANGLIIMPLDASNAGKNYGTGGDFTANSAPYVGARGGSEFWARSAKCSNDTSKITGSLSFVETGAMTFAFCYYGTGSSARSFIKFIADSYNDINISSDTIVTKFRANNTKVFTHTSSTFGFNTNGFNVVLFSVNTSTSPCTITTYRNGVNVYNAGFTDTGVQNSTFKIAGTIDILQFNEVNAGAQFYFTTDYIDFSQEVNRNKFVDQLGYPKDLNKQIDAGVIPKPLIYLPFNDPSNLGLNLGTGGNFTVNGTITQGADVNG